MNQLEIHTPQKQKLREKWSRFWGFTSRDLALERHNELSYFLALNELKRCHGLNTPLYPFGAAANSSLLYLICRSLKTFNFKSVLELGCGQSSLLIDDIKSQNAEFSILSLEENDFWRKQIQSKVGYTISHAPVVEQTVQNRSVKAYSNWQDKVTAPFDFLLIDGPLGSSNFSRWGALEFVDKHLAEDFVILFDDVHRKGERDTANAAMALLKAKGVPFWTQKYKALKHQWVIVSEKYRDACYF